MPLNTQPFIRRAPFHAYGTGLQVNNFTIGVGGVQSGSGTVPFDVVPTSELVTYSAGTFTIQKTANYKLTVKMRAKVTSPGTYSLYLKKNGANLAGYSNSASNTFTKSSQIVNSDLTLSGTVPTDCKHLHIYEGILQASETFKIDYAFNEVSSSGSYVGAQIGDLEFILEELT